MDNELYLLLKQWHDLLVSGVITEADFEAKKKELLGETIKNFVEEKIIPKEKLKESVLAEQNQTPETFRENTLSSSSKPVESSNLNQENWVKKNRILLISVLVVVVVGLAAYFLFLSPDSIISPALSSVANNTSTQDSDNGGDRNPGFYTVKPGLERAYFYNQPNEYTRRKAYLVQQVDSVHIESVENVFGYTKYTNSKGQSSVGWVRMQDLIRISN